MSYEVIFLSIVPWRRGYKCFLKYNKGQGKRTTTKKSKQAEYIWAYPVYSLIFKVEKLPKSVKCYHKYSPEKYCHPIGRPRSCDFCNPETLQVFNQSQPFIRYSSSRILTGSYVNVCLILTTFTTTLFTCIARIREPKTAPCLGELFIT